MRRAEDVRPPRGAGRCALFSCLPFRAASLGGRVGRLPLARACRHRLAPSENAPLVPRLAEVAESLVADSPPLPPGFRARGGHWVTLLSWGSCEACPAYCLDTRPHRQDGLLLCSSGILGRGEPRLAGGALSPDRPDFAPLAGSPGDATADLTRSCACEIDLPATRQHASCLASAVREAPRTAAGPVCQRSMPLFPRWQSGQATSQTVVSPPNGVR
jgi:hypothetical protein